MRIFLRGDLTLEKAFTDFIKGIRAERVFSSQREGSVCVFFVIVFSLPPRRLFLHCWFHYLMQ